MTTARSLLYTPGTRPDRVAKARHIGADLVIVDLEDAVPASEKDQARAGAAEALRAAQGTAGAPLWVRVNSETLEDDLGAVLGPALAGLVLPKAELQVVDRVAEILAAQTVPVIALVETATGVLHAEELARHPLVVRLAIGEADLAGELRLDAGETAAFASIRLQIVLASSVAGLVAPVGPVERRLDSEDVLVDSSRQLVRQGFRGRTVLHPRQLATVNQTFSPNHHEIARARAVIAEFEAAGSGTLVSAGGEFVDKAVLRQAHEVLERIGPS